MPFFKIPMEDSPEHEALFPWVIAEGRDARSAYDLAVCHIPDSLGEANDEERPIESVSDKELLNTRWPIFTLAFFAKQNEDTEAGLTRRAG